MQTISLPGKINNQIIDEIGDYLNGNVSSHDFDLTRLDEDVLLLIYRYGRIKQQGMVDKIRGELRQELNRRKYSKKC